MTVFISHSFQSKPEFENVADALDAVGVPYWKPTEITSGEPLREQLRAAIGRCGVCVFVATHRSVESSWCNAELGAFWGAGVPIIVYLADSSLTKDALPEIVQGDVWERKLSLIAKRAKELDDQAAASGATAPLTPTAKVSSITVEQLEKLIAGAISLIQAHKPTDTRDSTADFAAIATESANLVVRGAEATNALGTTVDESWQRHVLWVDDKPDNNRYERTAFESFGVTFTLAYSTDQARQLLDEQRFAAVISDMNRSEGTREGLELLTALRVTDQETPFFLYSALGNKDAAMDRGAQGATNVASELIDMVVSAISAE